VIIICSFKLSEVFSGFLPDGGLTHSKNRFAIKKLSLLFREHRYIARYESYWAFIGLLSLQDMTSASYKQAFDVFWEIVLDDEDLIGIGQARLLLRCWEHGQT